MKIKKIIALLCSAAMMCTCTAFADTETADNAEVTETQMLDGNTEAAEEPNDADVELMAGTQVFDGGTGTEDDPFLISTEEQLELVNDFLSYSFKLTNDIELTSQWEPISGYSGTFDGDGYTVSGLSVQNTSEAGMFGANIGTIQNLKVKGTVSSEYISEGDAGLIAGYNQGTIQNCAAYGEVSSSSSSGYAGLIVGYNDNGTVKNCFSKGKVSGRYSGGILGYIEYGTIQNCCSVPTITLNNNYEGGIYGETYNSYSNISNCYFDRTVSGLENNGTPKSTPSMKLRATYENWDFENIWGIDAAINDGYPYLLCMKDNGTTSGTPEAVFDGGTGTKDDPFLISTVEQLKLINDFLSYSFKLTNDITLTSPWEPISSYSGTFDGNGYTVSGLNVQNASYAGMFGSNSGTIQNLKVKGTASSKSDGYYYAGLIAGDNDNGTVKNCFSKGKVSGGYCGGGILGFIKEGTMQNCCSVSTVWSRSYEGGIYGKTFNSYSNISNCYFDRTVSGLEYGGTPKRTVSMKIQSTYENWDFENIWGIDAAVNDGYPYLLCMKDDNSDTSADVIISVDPTEFSMKTGDTVKLNVSVEPADYADKVVWSSSKPAVAYVSADGTVTAKAIGSTVISASVFGKSASCTINVTDRTVHVPVTGIEISNNVFGLPIEVDIGKTALISYSVKPDNATNKSVIWTSGDSNIATVENGRVTGVAEGSTTITATTVDGGYSASCSVKVTKPTVAVTGIQINPEQMTVNVKEQKKLQAVVTPSDATDTNITFKSNNNAIANVTADGTVTGVSPGTTLIQAISDTSAGKFIAFCTVTVPKPVVEVTSVKLDKSSLEIVEGKTVPLKAVIKPSNATYKLLTWSTSEESVATVSQDGYVTAQGEGDAVISVTATNGVHVECSVKVLPSDTPAQLRVENATVKAGKEIPITVSIASNPGISTFNFDLTYDNTKMYPVSYTKDDVLENVNVVTPLGSQSFEDKTSVRFLCSTKDSKNMDTDGDLITVVFKTLENVEYGDYTIGIVPSGFTNEFYDTVNLVSNDCTLSITDYTIGDVNNDDVVDLKDSMILGQYIAGFGITLTPQGKKAAVSIYPDKDDDVNTSEPSLNDFQHLIRYLSDWQVELGKN